MQHAALPHRSPAHVYTGCCKDEEEEEERAERCDLSHSMRKEKNLFIGLRAAAGATWPVK